MAIKAQAQMGSPREALGNDDLERVMPTKIR